MNTQPPRVGPARKFLGLVLMSVAGLWIAASGVCTIYLAFDTPKAIGMLILFGGISCLVGGFFLMMGWILAGH